MNIVFTLPMLGEAADLFLEAVRGRRIIALHGEMGAGKTTFIGALCRTLGVESPVTSPTFPLVNEYVARGGERICHMDWYRLTGESEVVQAGLEEYLYSGMICLIEWSERAPGILPDNTVHAYLEILDPGTRRLVVSHPDPI